MSVDSKNEEAEDEIEVRPRTAAGCISCITCILAVAIVVGHYVVDVNMILLADGDASFEVTPSCDQRLGANYSFTLESELKYMVEHPRTFNSPTQVRFQWRSTVRSMKVRTVDPAQRSSVQPPPTCLGCWGALVLARLRRPPLLKFVLCREYTHQRHNSRSHSGLTGGFFVACS